MLDFLLSSPLETLEFTCLDLETTGLNPGSSEILEIAAVRFSRDKLLSQFNELVKPNRGIPEEASKVNGLYPEMVKNARPIKNVLSDFIPFLDGSILVIQNSNFDMGFLLYDSQIQQIPFPTLPVFCTLQMTRKLFPDFKKYNLVALRERFGIQKQWYRSETGGNIHEALDDSMATMEVFKRCMERNDNWKKSFGEVVFHEKGLKTTKDYSSFLF